MIKILRDKESGICRDCSDNFPSTSSQVSILSTPTSVHWFTGTPDTQYSYFKPFIFHPTVVEASEKTRSPQGEQVDRRHTLYLRHEQFYDRLKRDTELQMALRHIENIFIDELEMMITSATNNSLTNLLENEADEIHNLFNDSVETELRFYR